MHLTEQQKVILRTCIFKNSGQGLCNQRVVSMKIFFEAEIFLLKEIMTKSTILLLVNKLNQKCANQLIQKAEANLSIILLQLTTPCMLSRCRGDNPWIRRERQDASRRSMARLERVCRRFLGSVKTGFPPGQVNQLRIVL